VVTANPDYAAILAEARAEYFRYKSRTDLKDLQLSLGSSYVSGDRRPNQYDIGIRFSIPNPFVNRQVIRTGEAARRETEIGTEALKNEITWMIYELIQEILIGERELSILLLREQVLSDWGEYLKMRHDARMATQADIRAFDIQRLRLKAAVQQAQFTIHTARRSLQVLVKIPDEQLVLNPFPSDWEVVLAALEDDKMLIEDAFSRSAELARANAAYEKACAVLDTARARQIPWFDSVYFSYSPSFTESTDYSYSGELIPSRAKSDKWTVGVNMSLPVFAWFSSEKKMAIAEIEAVSLRITGIRQRIHNDMTEIITDLRDTLYFLRDYQSTFDSIPEPTRETIPDSESYYKLIDARLSASEYALKIELQCAHIYGQLFKVAGGWE
jgi:outer membrane protein TolC